MKLRGQWKFREYHTFFLYYAYPTFKHLEQYLSDKGKKLLEGLLFLLKAVQLTKGFEPEVSFGIRIYLKVKVFPILNLWSKHDKCKVILFECILCTVYYLIKFVYT